MAVFYTDTGSFGEVMVSGSGEGILSVSGSSGPLLSVSDITAGANVFQLTSASVHLFKVDQSKNVQISGSLIVTGSISLNGSAIGGGNLAVAAGGSTNTVSQLVFSNANGVSFGLNGSTLTATAAGGGGGGTTYNYFNPQDAYLQVAGQLGQGSLHIQPSKLPNVQFDRIVIPFNYSNATNSSNSFTVSLWMGFYTRDVSTLNLLSSYSTSYNITNSGTVGSYSLYGGLRLLSISITNTVTLAEEQYYVGMLSRTTTGGGAGMSMSNMLASQLNSSFSGVFGVASNVTVQYTRGLGMYSATTSAMPVSVRFNQLTGNSSAYLRQPLWYVVNGTV
jgi:hypothetical protein